MLPCTEEEVEALFYFIYNLYLTLYPIRTLSIPFPNFTAVHGVGVAQAKPACKHTIATRKCYQYNTYVHKARDVSVPNFFVLLLFANTACLFHLYQADDYCRCVIF